jgi:lycopene cyclase domain-containing protein
MTYLGFLVVVLGLPLVVAGLLTRRDARRGQRLSVRAVSALAILVATAVVYTTPWDNYLVATRVWWYDPARVLGLTLGWVPLEEYAFFVLQTVAVGLLLLVVTRRLGPDERTTDSPALRIASAGALTLVWLAAVSVLVSGPRPATYMALLLAWALPPLALQLAVGADILWRYRRAVFTVLLGATAYLGLADAVAIGAGVWTIDPGQSLGLWLGGALPVEELVFFLVTNSLVVFGLTLAMAPEMGTRWAHYKAGRHRLFGRSAAPSRAPHA